MPMPRRIVVSRGDRVAKGQVIGYAGETGDVTAPQLHFEIRHDTQPVNPRPLLMASWCVDLTDLR